MIKFLYPLGIGTLFYNMFVLNGKFRYVGQSRDLVRTTDVYRVAYQDPINPPVWNISVEAMKHLSLKQLREPQYQLKAIKYSQNAVGLLQLFSFVFGLDSCSPPEGTYPREASTHVELVELENQ